MSRYMFVQAEEPEEPPIPLRCRESAYKSPCECLAERMPDGSLEDLGHRGGALEWLIECAGEAFDAFDDNLPPDEPGVYCFVGGVQHTVDRWRSVFGEHCYDVQGEWRTATEEDRYLETTQDPPTSLSNAPKGAENHE